MKKIISAVIALAIGFTGLLMPFFDTALTAKAYGFYDDFRYENLNDGTIKILRYFGEDDDIVIPSTINGKRVKLISAEAFHNCEYISSISIPGTVEKIAPHTFENMRGPRKVTLGEGFKIIGSYAFQNNTYLESITFPESLTSIGDYAFDGCTGLTSITIPGSVHTVGQNAFSHCKTLNRVKISEGVSSIGDYAFLQCSNLSTILLPKSITYIGSSAFSITAWLAAKREVNPIVIVNNIVIDGSEITSDVVVLPERVTGIAGESFSGCMNLKSITIPENTTYIGKEAFIECTDLKSVTIPKSVKEIGENAFGICFDDDGAMKKAPGFKIKCYSGTAAEKYAIEHGVDYETFDRSTVKVGTVKTAGFVCSDNAIKINWEKVANASGYRIYRYDTISKTWNTVVTVSGGNNLSYKHTGRKSGTTYKYKVKAYIKSGGKTYWGKASSTLTTTTKPSKPVLKSSYTATSSAIRIKWNAIKGADGYYVYRYNEEKKKWVQIDFIYDGSECEYRDKWNLKSKTSYKYKVKAYRKLGDVYYKSAASDVKTYMTK